MTHSDYDNHEFFNELNEALAPLGFEDYSYCNDVCPSIGLEIVKDMLIQIFVEYKDPALRECEGEEALVICALDGMNDNIVDPVLLLNFDVKRVQEEVAHILATLAE